MSAKEPSILIGTDVIELLAQLAQGEKHIVSKNYPLIYGELKNWRAISCVMNAAATHCSQPRSFTNIYLKFVDHTLMNWRNRAHFSG